MAAEAYACSICGSDRLEEMPEFASLPRVTSDCLPFPQGGKLAVCADCGGAQAIPDERWLADIGEIYSQYRVYHQSGGVEQHVFDAAAGALRRRSDVLLDRLVTLECVPRSGKVLDIGCGPGSTLLAFSARGGWELYGLEMDERNLPLLAAIPGFAGLYTGAVSDVPQQFDVVTMVHSLEHFPEPASVLQEVRGKLAGAGHLFVQVPDAEANPFEYLVADHRTHFTAATLRRVAERSGLEVECVAGDWVAKELSLVARAGGGVRTVAGCSAAGVTMGRVRGQAKWLCTLVEMAREAARGSRPFGIFGASIAGTWLCGVLRDNVAFFVEEDPHRVGRTHMGRPIVSPAQVPPGSVVLLALIPSIAARIRDRLGNPGFDLLLPPVA